MCTAAFAQPLVVVDPGHGARDPGAVGCGSEEDDVVLDVGLRLRPLLQAAGLRVAMTRAEARFVELRARAAFANDRGARVFVSVHANANDGAPASGTETWIANGALPDGVQLAGRLQRELVATWGLRDRGVKRANFTVLTATTMPAALTELGFINHCERDSRLLANPAERQRIAEAHARAIADHLGAEPPPPGPDMGTLIGVVFEDVGVGLEDTTRRLAGANVRVVEADESSRSAAETGAWRFELEPGDYTVRATLRGFEEGSRRCAVQANAETWCSVGLHPEGPPEPDAAPPPPVPDAAPMDAATVDAALVDVAHPDGEVSDGRLDPARPDPDGAQLADARPRLPDGGFVITPTTTQSLDGGGCHCDLAPAAPAPVPWWLALCLLPYARRRRAAFAALLLVASVGAADGHVPDVAPGGEHAVYGELHRPFLPTAERLLVPGRFGPPVLAPDGRHVAIATPALDVLYVARTADGALQRLAAAPRVGLNPRWHRDARTLAFRAPHQSATAAPLHARTLDGRDVTPQAPRHGVRAWIHGDAVRVWEGGAAFTASPAGDRYFHARVSPRGDHVVFWGLRTGLHLLRIADAAHFRLGPGGHPSFDPTGRFLVFERTADEGAQLIAGDLFLHDLRHPEARAVALTQTPDRIELAPSIAGGHLVFLTEAGVVLADLPLPTD